MKREASVGIRLCAILAGITREVHLGSAHGEVIPVDNLPFDLRVKRRTGNEAQRANVSDLARDASLIASCKRLPA